MKIHTKDIVLTAIFTAITCIFSILEIPIGPVPITLGVFATILCGFFLKPIYAFLSQVIHILLGIVGIPVFGGGESGLGVIVGPTGGYILATPIMSLLIAGAVYFSVKSLKKNHPDKKTIEVKNLFLIIISLVLSIIICYVIGTVQFHFSTEIGILESLAICVVPFIPFDAGKALVSLLLFLGVYKRLDI